MAEFLAAALNWDPYACVHRYARRVGALVQFSF